MPVQRHPISGGPDDAQHAAHWAAGVAQIAGLLTSVLCTLALPASAEGGMGPEQLWIAAGVLGGVGMIAGGWRLMTHAEQRRGGALPSLLAIQLAMLMAGGMLVAILSDPVRLLNRGPEPLSVVFTCLLIAGPTLLNVRALVLCGGPHWRRIAPLWVEQGFVLGRVSIILAGVGLVLAGPGTVHS